MDYPTRIVGVLQDEHEQRLLVPTDFGHSLRDPYAVHLNFNPGSDHKEWIVSIELFTEAFDRPDRIHGYGDVTITYYPTDNQLWIGLQPPEGVATIAFPATAVAEFINSTRNSATDNVRETALDIFFEKVEKCANQSR